MNIDRPELHASGFRAILEVARDELGAAAVDELLTSLGTTAKQVEDPNAWFSLEFAEALMDAVVKRAKDPAILDRASMQAFHPRNLGVIYPLFRSFGSPALLYSQLSRLTQRFNKVTKFSVEWLGPRHISIRTEPHPGAPHERTPHLCRVRLVQLSEGPRLFDLPAAQIAHTQCMLRGADACVYDVRWSEHRRPIFSLGGLALGAAAGVGMMVRFDYAAAAIACVPGLAFAGWAIGRVSELRRDLRDRLNDLSRTQQALGHSADAHERRYAELLEAKAEVEQRVEQRTADLRLATQQLSTTLAQVQELDRAKTDFFSNVSHDLRTPLTLILGPLGEMAQGREPPGGQARAVEVMLRNGTRLLDLINQILDLAKIDAGKMQLARVPTSLPDLARLVESRFGAQAHERKLQLSVTAAAIAPMAIDPAWIETALTNLVGNAMRFARSKVAIRVREGDGAVVLEVEDDGPGIAPGDIATVFDRFAQGSDVQSRKSGTGLGLAIAREAARMHGGDVSVRSVPDESTVFALMLPRTMSAAADGTSMRVEAATKDRTAERSDGPSASANSDQLPPAATSDQIEWAGPDPAASLVLVVEDDDDLRGFTSAALATTYRVRAARNGEEALVRIAEEPPDAVVSDVVMPKMDGYELARRLRQRDDSRTLPIILLTARRDVGRVLEGFEAGADDYLTKPFQARELLARVGVHVRLRRLVSEMAHRERLASLGTLAASLAHQIRNPLNAIVAGLPAMRRKLSATLDRRDDEMFGAMIDSGERINTLITDLMDLSRVDREAIARFKPADGVRACMRLIEARTQGTVAIEADLDDTVEIVGKAGDLSHVFLNLIDNAVRAAEPTGRVRLTMERRGKDVIFEVGDSGPGIPAGGDEAVFAPFYTTRSPGEGTGLGLAIAKQVVIQHGGSITVGRSELGGALFRVSLPIASPAAPPDPAYASASTVH